MTDAQLVERIGQMVELTVQRAFKALGIENKVKSNDENAFKKTEQILWNYPTFKSVMEGKKEQIKEIKRHGVPTTSASVVEYQDARLQRRGLETKEESTSGMIRGLKEDITWLNAAIYRIDSALAYISDDEYFGVVERYYFERESLEDIAADYGIDKTNISRRKNKLVRKMALYLFPKEAVTELME